VVELGVFIEVGLGVIAVAALAGQAWANQRATNVRLEDTNERLSDTNKHLVVLNSKTFTSHQEIGKIIGALSNLPCRRGSNLCDFAKDGENI
jgi:hypothetical protein